MPLVFVPTPLGNLRDITLRALDALRDCELLVAEDSRVARRLLSALEISRKEIWSYHEHNMRSATQAILERARTQIVAVTTDAGMPGISDPGTHLVAAAREAGIAIEVLPGPSAVISAALLSGFPMNAFTFAGFPPRTRSARRHALSSALQDANATIFFESPQRIVATLHEIGELEPARRIFLLREYTKMHEQQVTGTAHEVLLQLQAPVRGEIVFVVSPSTASARATPDNEALTQRLDALLDEGLSVSAVAKSLAEAGFGVRRYLYAAAMERKAMRETPTP